MDLYQLLVCPEINWVNLQWACIGYLKPMLHRTLNSKFGYPERSSILKMEAADYYKMSVTTTGTTHYRSAEYRNLNFHFR
jgi:hypothetical protein